MLIFNLYSYYRCSKVQSENVKKLMYQYGTDVASQFMKGAIVAKFFWIYLGEIFTWNRN